MGSMVQRYISQPTTLRADDTYRRLPSHWGQRYLSQLSTLPAVRYISHDDALPESTRARTSGVSTRMYAIALSPRLTPDNLHVQNLIGGAEAKTGMFKQTTKEIKRVKT